MLATRAADASVPIVYVNLVGGQDELVFDGASLVFDEQGHLVARARQFDEDLLVVDLDVRPAFRQRLLDPRGRLARRRSPRSRSARRGSASHASTPRIEPVLAPVHEVYEALVLGTRDYVRKNGFTDVLIGALGRHRLVARRRDRRRRARRRARRRRAHAVALLERGQHHRRARRSPTNLGIRTYTIPIEPAHAAFEEMLAPVFDGDRRRASPRRTSRRASAATCS